MYSHHSAWCTSLTHARISCHTHQLPLAPRSAMHCPDLHARYAYSVQCSTMSLPRFGFVLPCSASHRRLCWPLSSSTLPVSSPVIHLHTDHHPDHHPNSYHNPKHLNRSPLSSSVVHHLPSISFAPLPMSINDGVTPNRVFPVQPTFESALPIGHAMPALNSAVPIPTPTPTFRVQGQTPTGQRGRQRQTRRPDQNPNFSTLQ